MNLTRLIWKEPWLAPIVLNVKNIIPTETIKTVGITADGKSIYYNKKYWNSLSQNEKLAVQIHEMMHILCLHEKRRKGRIQEIWNIACDMEINYILKESGYFMPKNTVKGTNDNAENNYDYLMKYHVKIIKSSNKNDGKNYKITLPHCDLCDDILESTDNINSQENYKDFLEKAIENSLNLCGNGDTLLSRNYSKRLSKTNWQYVFLNLLKSFIGDDFDYTSYEFDEFQICEDILSPKPYAKICVLVDESGSINDSLYSQFLGELQKMEKYADIKISGFSNNTKLNLVNLKDYKRTRNGGTCILKPYSEAESMDFDCIVVLTDGYLEFPKQEKIHTIWVMPQSFQRKNEVII